MESKVYSSYLSSLPPLNAVRLSAYAKHYNLPAEIIAGIMFEGLTGSYMDNLVAGMLLIARQKGRLTDNMPVIEVSSGTFAVALTITATRLGHNVYLIVPAGANEKQLQRLAGLGACIIKAEPGHGRQGAVEQARQLEKELNGYFLNYMSNDDNPEYHRRVTGPALLKACGKQPDIVVIGVGSGGTVTGVGEHLNAWTSGTEIVAVEPYESRVISGGFAGHHNIPGLGVGFVPDNYNPYIVNEVISVSSGDAVHTARDLFMLEGIPAAPASGATVAVAKLLALRPENAGKCIVPLLGIRRGI